MPHRRPPRVASTEYIGAVRIFFTMCAFRRRSLFTEARIVDPLCVELLRSAAECDVEVIAYCFMPDHLHFLTEGAREDADAGRFAGLFRRRTGLVFRQSSHQRLWQEGYFDRHLRDEDRTADVVSYIVANPVRAGLCQALEEHPFLGSARYSVEELNMAVQWRP